jgi:D-psicose/D-tagatose/L-ribulose 3-epimerase
MKFGMNLLLWTDVLTEAHYPLLERLKKMGYDGVEIPIFDPDVKKYAALGKRLDDMGLERTAVTVRGGDDNPISADAAVRAKGVAATSAVLESCQAAGMTHLCGPYHSALGVFSGQGPTEEEWKWGVESMRQVAEQAGKCGVMLAVEYLNRFETYLLTSVADTVRFIHDVGHPNCRMMYDTFHANIEEKNLTAAIQACQAETVHVHISENDRGTPGEGHVHWDETFDALKATGYEGWMVVEAFGLALPALAAATKIWRRMYQDEEQLARDALVFMKREWGKRA